MRTPVAVPALPAPPEDAARLEALALLCQALRRLTGLPVADPRLWAMAVALADATPHLLDLLDWGYGDLRVYVERGWIAGVAAGRRYLGTPRPKAS